jgi:cytochrome c6
MKKSDTFGSAIVTVAALGFAFVVAGVAPVSMALADEPAAAVDGADIWNKKCKTCHGADGKATPVGLKKGSPENLANETAKMGHEKIVEVVKEGKDKMPAFKDKLSAEEVEAVSKYCKTLGKPDAP